MKILDIYAKLKKDLNEIEKELENSIYSDYSIMRETSAHLLSAGGKRIRPVFVLLSGQFGDYQLDQMKNIAVPMELIHMATLVHDDVIDDADIRRGQLTVKSKWDNRVAMYTGDYIFAKALSVITDTSNPLVHQVMSKAIVEMCIGEMEQIRFFFQTEQTIRNYLLRIKRKTALLIAVSCQLGAIVANTPSAVANKLFQFGYNVGMAFQIRDDILDLCGTEKQIGKPPGSDIKQGNITLPVIFALQDITIKDKLLQEIAVIQNSDGQADANKCVQIVRKSRGIAQAEELTSRYINKAIQAISGLPDVQAKEDLIRIAHFVGTRSN